MQQWIPGAGWLYPLLALAGTVALLNQPTPILVLTVGCYSLATPDPCPDTVFIQLSRSQDPDQPFLHPP